MDVNEMSIAEEQLNLMPSCLD